MARRPRCHAVPLYTMTAVPLSTDETHSANIGCGHGGDSESAETTMSRSITTPFARTISAFGSMSSPKYRAGLIAQRIPARPFELEQDVPHRVFRHASLSTQNRRTGPPAKLRGARDSASPCDLSGGHGVAPGVGI